MDTRFQHRFMPYSPILGVWYFTMTRSDYKALKLQKGEVYFNDEDILDA